MQTCRRRQARYPLGQETPASVEFRYPDGGDGRTFRLGVADMSASGLGFYLEETLPDLEIGTTIQDVTFRYGDQEMALDLLVLHVTQHFAGDAICGCLIYPATDGDLVRFKEILSALEKKGTRSGAPATS